MEDAFQLVAQLVRIGTGTAEQVPGRFLLRHGPEQVIGVQVRAAGIRRLPRGGADHLAGMLAEQLGEVDPLTSRVRAPAPRQITSEVIVEGAAVSAAWREVSAGHCRRPQGRCPRALG
ncbi:MAG: hypothetical protein ACXVW3_13275 [Nocardioidaceae bacterium]